MAENDKQNTPPTSYYERPYLPGPGDRVEFHTIPLLPVEAHTILIDNAGKPLSTLDRLTLLRISESEEDEPIDFQAERRRVAAELDTDEDWD